MCPAPAKGVGATAGEAEVRNRNMKLTIECGSWCLAQEKRPETLAPPPHFHSGLRTSLASPIADFLGSFSRGVPLTAWMFWTVTICAFIMTLRNNYSLATFIVQMQVPNDIKIDIHFKVSIK